MLMYSFFGIGSAKSEYNNRHFLLTSLFEMAIYKLWNMMHSFLRKRDFTMQKPKYTYWQDGDMWLGYLEEFPDYWTQGQTEPELKENLIDLYKDLTTGEIPHVRRIAELEVS